MNRKRPNGVRAKLLNGYISFLFFLQVKIYSGPRLNNISTFAPPLAKSMKTEYGSLECAVEIVDNVEAAISHINTFGSAHTDVIVTENGKTQLLASLSAHVANFSKLKKKKLKHCKKKTGDS